MAHFFVVPLQQSRIALGGGQHIDPNQQSHSEILLFQSTKIVEFMISFKNKQQSKNFTQYFLDFWAIFIGIKGCQFFFFK